MLSQIIRFRLTFMLILSIRLLLQTHANPAICQTCTCEGSPIYVYCMKQGLTSVPHTITQNVEYIDLSQNEITSIKEEPFQNATNLKHLWMYNNKITNIEEGSFQNLRKLEYLSFRNNSIKNIGSKTFHKLTNLMFLYLERNEIKKIEKGTFINLSNLKYLHLDNNEISVIEEGSFQNLPRLEILWLYNNKIMNIKDGSFQNVPSLQTLSLLKNGLTSIGERTFQVFPNLVTLYLEYNKINTIENGAFKNLVNLKSLHLDNNEITIIEEGTFQNLLSLQTLWLYNNKITDVQEGSFKSTPSLETLSLLRNRITNIKSGTFQKLTNLKFLYMEHNNIKKIEQGTFQNNAKLQNLHLDNNQITAIEKGTFQNLGVLEALYLYSNEIRYIEEGAFQNLANLKMLSLLHNRIEYIQAGTFNTLTALRTLNMSHNQIKGYDDGTFLFLSDLANIDLRHNNYMTCGCHLPAFYKYIQEEYNRKINLYGSCLNDQDSLIHILQYSQCENYELFPTNLQCQTCSAIMCNDSDEPSCPGSRPVCQITVSLTDITFELKRSCSTYRKCTEAMRDNTVACNSWSSRTSSCVSCCVGQLCNEKGFNEWPNTYEFHLISTMNSSLMSGRQDLSLKKNISRALDSELLSMNGAFKVEYCGMQTNKDIFTVRLVVRNETTKDEVEQSIYDILNMSKTLHDLGIGQRNVEIIKERRAICNEDTILTDDIILNWPMTKAGKSVTIQCQANIATRYCSRMVLALEMPTSHSNMTQKCAPFTGTWENLDTSQCKNIEWIHLKLKDIKEQNIDEGNIEKFSKQLQNISEISLYFNEEDFNLAVDILEKMVPLISKVSTNITLNYILLSINNLKDTPEEIMNGAEQAMKSVTRMLNIIKTIPDKISLEEQQVTVLYSNLGIGVTKVKKDAFNGATFRVLSGNAIIRAKTLTYNSSQPEDTMKTFISLPKSLFKGLKSESVSRISFFFIEDDKLYKVIQASSTEVYTKITSHIISANIPNMQITNLDEPVTMLFSSIYPNQQCAYWEESSGQNPHWSTDGCITSTYVPGEKVVCSCNHLTSFALVKYNEEYSFIVSHISCGISLVLLILTTAFNVAIKDLRSCLNSKITVALCISLAFINIVFLFGMHPYALKIMASCKAVAAVLQYSLMVYIIWMNIKVFHDYKFGASGYSSNQKRFMIRSSVLALGFPAIIILSINFSNNYIRFEQVCWISKIPFYITFLVPVVVTFIFQAIFIVFILRSNAHKEMRTRTFICLFCLLFLSQFSCFLAFLAFDGAVKVFDILFGIANFLQSLFIFLHVYKRDISKLISQCVCNQKENNTTEMARNSQFPRSDSRADSTPQPSTSQTITPQPSTSEGSPEMNEQLLMDVAKTLADKWTKVGIYLHISATRLEVIKHNFTCDIEEQAFQMLLAWLRGSEDETNRIKILREALRRAECSSALKCLPKA